MEFKVWLEREFLQRRKRNPQYSLRAFARQIGLPPSRVSEIFHDRRGLSDAKVNQVLERLKVPADQAGQVKASLVRQKVLKKSLKDFGKESGLPELQVFGDQEFQTIADPIHYAVLALVDGGRKRASFGKELGVSQRRIDQAVKRLEKVGLLEEISGELRLREHWLSTETDHYSRALRLHHKRKLRHAIQAIEKVPLLQRDLNSWTINIDPGKLPLAKKLVQDFQRKMARLLTSENQSEVYHLNIQLVPFRLESGGPLDSE